MLVFNSEMHIVTFLLVVLEMMMLTCQLFCYYARPHDKRRLWSVVLLGLLVFYNVASGVFPDAHLPFPVVVQNMLVYGSGFIMASYLPWYFYKVFNLNGLRFHVLYGVGLFLLFPFFIFFVLIYPITEDLDLVIHWGMIIPFLYSLVLFWSIVVSIHKKMRFKIDRLYSYSRMEMGSLSLAVMSWACMPLFSYLHLVQWMGALITNVGIFGLSVLYLVRSAAKSRIEHNKLLEMYRQRHSSFESNCARFKLTGREKEIVIFLGKGMTYLEVARSLFIAGKTVDSHVQNIFIKTGAKNKIELLQLIGIVLPGYKEEETGDKTGLCLVKYLNVN